MFDNNDFCRGEEKRKKKARKRGVSQFRRMYWLLCDCQYRYSTLSCYYYSMIADYIIIANKCTVYWNIIIKPLPYNRNYKASTWYLRSSVFCFILYNSITLVILTLFDFRRGNLKNPSHSFITSTVFLNNFSNGNMNWGS